MSERIQEPEVPQSEDSGHFENYGREGRFRSMSEVCSIGSASASVVSDDRKPSADLLRVDKILSPQYECDIDSMEILLSPENPADMVTGEVGLGMDNNHAYEKRSRLFSELTISDMPSDIRPETFPSLDITFPTKYEENMERRGQSIVQLREAAVKRVIIRSGTKISRFNIIYTKDKFYWPQETIRHCRTGRIKRGVVLKRQFGVYYPDKSKELIALKVMEKSAISECFQWDEDDVQTELGVMKELSESGGHENVLFLHDSLETKLYLIAVMELVDGDLHDLLASVHGREIALDVFHQILLGYDHLVQHGYYHCDLSLENIAVKFIPNHNGTHKTKIIAKVSDFGRVRKMDANGSAIIYEDEVAGKPYYLAPEAYVGSYEAGPADIWSLGIILFILLTGNPPFGIANDSDEVFEPFAHEGFAYLEDILLDASATTEDINILARMLDMDPSRRPTIAELVGMSWL